eukprot:CAMPEP_0171501408 /NCGR_PEP_ID=MMETSP0958-20121227/9542_1 /TAXON_ID=87120 /ORGANISM="Aurantiochytrium limacinum, Strain ATCCMYA-1381" /LENGTH=171 /DNA_ID=CAMNT_0012036221 /DNA_START=252 /DNA_END=764 /DNA_ORIENTATION=+
MLKNEGYGQNGRRDDETVSVTAVPLEPSVNWSDVPMATPVEDQMVRDAAPLSPPPPPRPPQAPAHSNSGPAHSNSGPSHSNSRPAHANSNPQQTRNTNGNHAGGSNQRGNHRPPQPQPQRGGQRRGAPPKQRGGQFTASADPRLASRGIPAGGRYSSESYCGPVSILLGIW